MLLSYETAKPDPLCGRDHDTTFIYDGPKLEDVYTSHWDPVEAECEAFNYCIAMCPHEALHIVVCLDLHPDEDTLVYVQPTRRRFCLRAEAELYASTIARGRCAVIITLPSIECRV